MLSLTGDAAVCIDNLSDFTDFSHAESNYRFEDRFGAACTLVYDRHQLCHRQKQKHETYVHLSQDLLRLANHVYRAGPHLA